MNIKNESRIVKLWRLGDKPERWLFSKKLLGISAYNWILFSAILLAVIVFTLL